MNPDLDFLRGLLEIFPFASGDSEARGAIWNIMLRLLVQVRESEMSPQSLGRYVSVLTSKSDLIEDDLLDLPLNAPNSKARTTSVSLTYSSYSTIYTDTRNAVSLPYISVYLL